MRAGIRLVMGVLAVLAMCSAVVKADRKPFELEDLVEQSDLVVVGEVVNIRASESNGNRRVARIVPGGAALKGELDEEFVIVEYEWAPSAKSESLVQFEVGAKYCLFLTSDEGAYKLVNQFDGAQPVSDRAKKSIEKRVRGVARKNAETRKLHEDLHISLSIEEPLISLGENPVLRFEVVNTGTTAISLPGEVVSDSGKLALKGRTSLLFASVRGSSIKDQVRLGGRRPIRRSKPGEQVIGPGERMVWKAAFEWGDYGKKPGKYQIVWRCGKTASLPVVYEIREKQ